MKTRSDGRLPDRTKPKTKADHEIHLSHIIDSGQYNLRHDHDHTKELVFDYGRLNKEVPKEASKLQRQTLAIMNPLWSKMNLKLVRK